MVSHNRKLDRKLSVLIFLRPALERKYQVTLSYIRKIANALKVKAPYFGSIKLLLLELVAVLVVVERGVMSILPPGFSDEKDS